MITEDIRKTVLHLEHQMVSRLYVQLVYMFNLSIYFINNIWWGMHYCICYVTYLKVRSEGHWTTCSACHVTPHRPLTPKRIGGLILRYSDEVKIAQREVPATPATV